MLQELVVSIIKSIFKGVTLPWWLVMIISALLNAIGIPVPAEIFGVAGGGLLTQMRFLKFGKHDKGTLSAGKAIAQSSNTGVISGESGSLATRLANWLEGKTPLQSGAVVIGLATTAISLVSVVMYYTVGHALALPSWFIPMMLSLGFQLNFTATKKIG